MAAVRPDPRQPHGANSDQSFFKTKLLKAQNSAALPLLGGVLRITDAAKVEIARQFETRDRMDNAQLKMVVGVAGAKCQMNMMNNVRAH